MNLKRLELSGFKSFARATKLEFPSRITAIVGPNGSGKSNVVEALRWVLGEQSIRQLRGRRGEDLIFAGSSASSEGGSATPPRRGGQARAGRAAVSLVFDNSSRTFPLEFDEVALARHIRRDGANDYFINGSAVRLKDISALLGRVGLGASHYHIISQGAADRILWASSAERRRFIEEALGFAPHQTKREETIKKLAETDENMKRVLLLQQEIAPRAAYIKTQMNKIQKEEILRNECALRWQEYAALERATLEEQKKNRDEKEAPIIRRKNELERACADARARTHQEEQKSKEAFGAHSRETEEEKRLRVLDDRRSDLERELGRIEGRVYHQSAHDMASALRALQNQVNHLLSLTAFEEIKQGLRELLGSIIAYLTPISRKEKEEERVSVQKGIASVQAEAAVLRARMRKQKESHAALFERARRLQEELRVKEQEFFGAKEALVGFAAARDQWQRRVAAYEASCMEAERAGIMRPMAATAADTAWESDAQEQEHRRVLERLRIKIEEVGQIDRNLTKEFEEIAERQQFLQKEYDDLASTKTSLVGLTEELAGRLAHDFNEGFGRINEAFTSFFDEMFPGGIAHLARDEGDGVDIAVNLPRKRIKSLEVLSGGERALTAIALLFAISQVNPPPFLVLDETDAALDETNSRRYGAMLEELSKRTQLVVVTHNRETMKRAGVLYGVTMGADGVSRLLSVKLDAIKQDDIAADTQAA